MKKKLRLIFSFLLFIAIAAIGFQTINVSKHNQDFKRDAAEINHFKYGIFSVDAWKDRLSQIVSDEIDQLALTRGNSKQIKATLESQLEVLIDKIYERIKDKNTKTANGRFKQSIMDSFIDVKDIKAGIPGYAEAMMKKATSPETENTLKGMLKEKITKYMSATFDTRPVTLKDNIVKKYGFDDEEKARAYLAAQIQKTQDNNAELVLFMIILSIIMFVMESTDKGPLSKPQYFILTLTLICLLIVGVTTPMIDMEAKVTNFEFVLFDHPIKFRDQILYFQSKSVMDVFHLMITHKEIQMKLVGILMVSFSVVFPVLKIMSSIAYYFDFRQARRRTLIKWFVEKSGKWSMADVMVVSIFMAYIGFNGVLNSQLKNMESFSQSVEVLTTNGTALQPGFYLFFTYILLAMFLTGFIKNRPMEK